MMTNGMAIVNTLYRLSIIPVSMEDARLMTDTTAMCTVMYKNAGITHIYDQRYKTHDSSGNYSSCYIFCAKDSFSISGQARIYTVV